MRIRYILKCIILLPLIFQVNTVVALRTLEKKVYFEDLIGFSGYVEFDLQFEKFARQMQGRNAKLVLEHYDVTGEELAALLKAGYDLRGYPESGYTPEKFSFKTDGQVRVGSLPGLGASISYSKATSRSKLHLGKTSNDYTTPEFDEVMVKAMQEWAKQEEGRSHWEKTAQYEDIKVTELYITDFLNEIGKIITIHNRESKLKSADEAVSDAEKAMMTGSLARAKSLLDKAYKLDPKNERMIAASKKYIRLKKEKDDREQNNRVAEAEINARKREQDRIQNEKEEAALLQSWGTANLSPQNRERLNELNKRETDRKVAAVAESFNTIQAETRRKYEERSRAITEKYEQKRAAISRKYREAEEAGRENEKRWVDGIYKELKENEIKRLNEYGYIHDGTKENKQTTIRNMVMGMPEIEFENGPAPLRFFKFGYVTSSGEPVTSFKYDAAAPFADGLARVSIGDPYIKSEDSRVGYIDRNGKEVIPLVYHNGNDFMDGAAVVGNNSKYGLINKQGKVLVPLIYDDIARSKDSVRIVSNRQTGGKWLRGYISNTGKLITNLEFEQAGSLHYGAAIVKKNGKWGLISKSGKILVPLEYETADYLSERNFKFKLDGKTYEYDSEGNRIDQWTTYGRLSSTLSIIKNTFDKYAICDENKKLVTPFKFTDVKLHNDNYFYAAIDRKWGILDSNANEIVPFKYEYLTYMVPPYDIAEVELNNKHGFVNKKGEVVIPLIYESVGNVTHGLVNVNYQGKEMYIDMKGNRLNAETYELAFAFYEAFPYAMVKQDRKFGMIDTTGAYLLQPEFDKIDWDRDAQYFFTVTKDGKKGLYFKKNAKPATTVKYDEIYSWMYEGRRAVKVGDKWGFIDSAGTEIIPVKFNSVGYFHKDGLAVVQRKGRWGLVDRSGNEVVPVKYQEIKAFENGYAPAKLKGRWGCIDKNLKTIIPFKFEDAGHFYNGKAMVKLNGKYGFVDKNATLVIPCIYDKAEDFSQTNSRVVLNGKNLLINIHGEKQ